MKIKLNPITHQVQTKNGNSRQMPTFLLSNHGKFFDYEQRRHNQDDSCKKTNPLRNTSVVDFKGAPDPRPYPASIKNVSVIGKLWNDNPPSDAAAPKQKLIYINKIFGQKREYEVPTQRVIEHKHQVPQAYQTFANEKNGFSKPFQFSKLVDELASAKSLNRQNQSGKSFNEMPGATIPVEPISTRQNTHRSYSTTYRSRKVEAFQQPGVNQKEMRRMSCQSTLEKHQKIFQQLINTDRSKGVESYFNNALGHMVDTDNIIQTLQKNRKTRHYYKR